MRTTSHANVPSPKVRGQEWKGADSLWGIPVVFIRLRKHLCTVAQTKPGRNHRDCKSVFRWVLWPLMRWGSHRRAAVFWNEVDGSTAYPDVAQLILYAKGPVEGRCDHGIGLVPVNGGGHCYAFIACID